MGDNRAVVPTRSYKVPSDSSGKTIEIHIQEPDLRAQGLSLTTWTSSFILARQLHRYNIGIPTQRRNESRNMAPVLELGAGTGLVGLTAAALWKTSVLLTDLAPIVPGLAGNIECNKTLLSTQGGNVLCGTLDWDEPTTVIYSGSNTSFSSLEPQNKASVILAADTIYSPEHPSMLANVITTWLAPGQKSRFFMTYPLRVAYLDEIREFWQLMEAGGLEAIEEGKETASTEEWDDECLCEWTVWKWRADHVDGK